MAPVSEHPQTQASLRASFRELRNANDAVLAALEGQGGVRGEVVRLYRAFREQLARGWYDVEDLAEAAAAAVRQGDSPGLDELGLIVFYLPRDVSPAQTRLIEALARQGRCAVFLGVTGDAEADESTRNLASALQSMLGEARRAGGGNLGDSLLPGEAALHIAPNAHEELRWVIRRIVEEAAVKGTPFHRNAGSLPGGKSLRLTDKGRAAAGGHPPAIHARQ